MQRQIGYCTNVHAGADLPQTRANLERYALAVKERFSPSEPMGIGLWLSASTARKLLQESEAEAFAGWLREVGLRPFTLNGFPYGDFHSRVVKHAVYEPTWMNSARLEYTRDLIKLLATFLPDDQPGSISTLPICWGKPQPSRDDLQEAAANLRTVAEELAAHEECTGQQITLCLEPEPGCLLQDSRSLLRFYEEHLLNGDREAQVRKYLGICHDVCHAAVMFEEQAAVLAAYREAGLRVGKVQVSSAVEVRFNELDPAERSQAVEQLRGFAEERYLHQTCVRDEPGAEPRFYEDLPAALAAETEPAGEWRVHFHVPVYLKAFGLVQTSQPAIRECLAAAAASDDLTHYEVETYAWNVLPAALQQPDLAAGIAEELAWFSQVAQG